jgi:phosphoribosylamine---glycine ligase
MREKLNVLIVGSGGREHALAWKIKQSPLLSRLFVAPGNGGTDEFNVPVRADDVAGLCKFAQRNRCFTLIGPEMPLSLGVVDRLREAGVVAFGPTKEQALLETSKVYAKRFMAENDIPTPSFQVFDDPREAIEFSDSKEGNVVIKADGLASGKGVFVCSNKEEAAKAIHSIQVDKIFGDSGQKVVVEEKIEGKEASLMALCDGKDVVEFGTAVDHKRLLDNNRGPNTGGMGAYSPANTLQSNDVDRCIQKIVKPTVRKTKFSGFLYTGLMITKNGLKVLEFNGRLGDPETQAIIPRLKSDLLSYLFSVSTSVEGIKTAGNLEWSKLVSCCVMMCSEGYPYKVETGYQILGLDRIRSDKPLIFHSGTVKKEGKFYTSGGRVLGVTTLANSLKAAKEGVYSVVSQIEWQGEKHRSDIGGTNWG